jgi:hypothetical protein
LGTYGVGLPSLHRSPPEIHLMKTLDLNQLTVETFDVDATQSGPYLPIESTDQVPHCDGFTAGYC